ncbi:MAG: hypothetical protein PHE07_01625 [Bacteroidales bacterium]|nr:hypothetical protein [Bacteroidales bacterium]
MELTFYPGNVGATLPNGKYLTEAELKAEYPIFNNPAIALWEAAGDAEEGYVMTAFEDLRMLRGMYNIDTTVFATKETQLAEINRLRAAEREPQTESGFSETELAIMEAQAELYELINTQ